MSFLTRFMSIHSSASEMRSWTAWALRASFELIMKTLARLFMRRPKMTTPRNSTKMLISISRMFCGTMSPNPTVVSVVVVQYRAEMYFGTKPESMRGTSAVSQLPGSTSTHEMRNLDVIHESSMPFCTPMKYQRHPRMLTRNATKYMSITSVETAGETLLVTLARKSSRKRCLARMRRMIRRPLIHGAATRHHSGSGMARPMISSSTSRT
mmetsp:Transcript_40395/g.95993  ORF Transcript_40395/g.95993 Transcript_40395/m.95993 type:complete len:210 (+) Transcript_40395:1558-2187(+)